MDGHADRLLVVRRHLVPLLQKDDVLPIGQHDPLEPKLPPEDVCQHEPVGVRGDAVHFAAVDHDAHGTGLHSLGKGRQEHFPQLTFRNVGRRPVFPTPRHAVPEVVLEGGRHLDISLLKPSHHGFTHVARKLRIFAKRFPETRPTGVPSHVQHRGKVPRNAARVNFLGCPFRHLTNQCCVPSRGEGQLLWPQSRPLGVRRAMDGVHPIQGWDPFGVQTGFVDVRDEGPPLLGRVAVAGRIQDTANLGALEGLGHFGRVEPMWLFCFATRPHTKHAQRELGHLPHLFFQGHVRKQRLHARRATEAAQHLVRQAVVHCVRLTRLNAAHRRQESQNGNPSGKCGIGSVEKVNHLNERKGLGWP